MISQTGRILDDLLNRHKPFAPVARLPFNTAGGADTVNLAPFANNMPLYIVGMKSDGTVENLSSAPGYTITAVNDFDMLLLASGITKVDLGGLFDWLMGLSGEQCTISVTTGRFVSFWIVYTPTPKPLLNQYTFVNFNTVTDVTEYVNTMLRGMPIAFVVYGEGLLNEDQYSLDNETLTINPGGVENGLRLLVIPQSHTSCQWTTTAGTTEYYNSLLADSLTVGYVVYGQTILDTDQYTVHQNTAKIELAEDPETGKQLVIVGLDKITCKLTTEEGVNDYSSGLLNGIYIEYVIYGQAFLAPNEYSLNGDTITLNVGGVEAGKQLIIVKK